MIDRRSVLLSSLALAACGNTEAAPAVDATPLKSIAPFPIGVAAMSGHFDEPAWVNLALTHVSQLTPEWEMKMEYILSETGDYRWDAPDRIADFCTAHELRLYCTTLIWYSQDSAFFRSLDPARFRREYDRYIAEVVGRYRGRATGWDVVNEAVAEDGNGLRSCLWSDVLGQEGYIARAFEQAKMADPDAVLFLNDYNLENNPVKGATFLRLVERLLKAGVPVGGIGTQSHLDIEIPVGQTRAFFKEAARFGLPIHVSELDASLRSEGRIDIRSPRQKIDQQTARVAELTEAFVALPSAQRFAFTVWGLRDTDSWLRGGARDDGKDSPLLFDTAGRPNPMYRAVMAGLQGD
ncbi:endo-1,4-beta-xylanase [Brevundimonas sp. AJA228-03]|uniref:endo-1,4-beta-xylanase n=1 Tax=Brevundimonas sp. AJA228-03 TaxID=2752515 RepID=UPI001ADFC6EF|nr:endo-1,4-beta-xylanase [Brevundimonas sp. AJA228-03]QTN19206.1 endo-1,4-beta-xylanase [Brevundimonas sp. AJA228-03]